MTGLLVFLTMLGLVVYGLERNHRRRRPPRVNGSVNFEDRDGPRVTGEARAVHSKSLSRNEVRPVV